MSKDTEELELSGPPSTEEVVVKEVIKEEKPKKASAKKSKSSLSKEHKEYLASFFGNLAISYGDPIDGENPAIADQRKRALAIDEFLKSTVK